MEINGVISSAKLNKICSAEGIAFNLCIWLNDFTEITEIEISHCRYSTGITLDITFRVLTNQKWENILNE